MSKPLICWAGLGEKSKVTNVKRKAIGWGSQENICRPCGISYGVDGKEEPFLRKGKQPALSTGHTKRVRRAAELFFQKLMFKLAFSDLAC